MRTIIAVFSLMFAVSGLAQEKPRVFVTDSKSWEISSGAGFSDGTGGGGSRGGARPQTAEIIKTFGERCPQVIINSKQEKADYIVLLDHEGGKSWIRKDNKVAVFNFDGDTIVSHSTRSLGASVQDACAAITADWQARGGKRAEAKPAVTAAPSPASAAAPEMTTGKISISSQPPAADIEVDGAFMGSTPSSIVLALGEHQIAVKKSGYKSWERKIKISGGEISVSAELEKTQ